MEKFVVTSDRKVLEFLFKKPLTSFPVETPSTSRSSFFRTFEQFLARWNPKDASPDLKQHQLPEITHAAQQNARSLSEQILVPEDIIVDILNNLKIFEKEKGYLDRDLSLPGLAKSIGTNHSYLSRVVNHIKEKSFKQYINDLRIEYAYIDLQTNPIKRRYTIKAIAFDNGFRSAESFSKKFLAKYGMYPSEFLKKIQAD